MPYRTNAKPQLFEEENKLEYKVGDFVDYFCQTKFHGGVVVKATVTEILLDGRLVLTNVFMPKDQYIVSENNVAFQNE